MLKEDSWDIKDIDPLYIEESRGRTRVDGFVVKALQGAYNNYHLTSARKGEITGLIKDCFTNDSDLLSANRIDLIMLTGSRLRHLNFEHNADYDVYVFVTDDPADILQNKSTSLVFHQENQAGNIRIDGKIMDYRKLYSLLVKSNPNIIELFRESEKIYDRSGGFADLLLEMSDNLFWINPDRYAGSVGGNLMQAHKQILKDKPNAGKWLALAIAFLDDFRRISKGVSPVKNQSDRLSGMIKRKTDRHTLTYNQEIVLCDKAEEEFSRIRDKWNKQIDTDENKRIERALNDHLKAIFIDKLAQIFKCNEQ